MSILVALSRPLTNFLKPQVSLLAMLKSSCEPLTILLIISKDFVLQLSVPYTSKGIFLGTGNIYFFLTYRVHCTLTSGSVIVCSLTGSNRPKINRGLQLFHNLSMLQTA